MLVFTHIPKTGGTTLSSILEKRNSNRSFDFLSVWSLFFTWKIPNINRLRDFLILSSRERDRFHLINGFIPTGVHHILSRPCAYIAFFRDPLERIISEYYYLTSYKRNNFYESIKNGELSLEKYVNVVSNERRYADEMTKRILGFDLLGRSWNWRRLDEMKTVGTELREQMSRAWEYPVTPEITEQAKKKLRDEFLFVGITEKFNDSVLLLAKKLKWESIPKIQIMNRRNPSYPLPTLSPQTAALFRDRNSADYELYAYAKQLFEQQWKKLRLHPYRLKQFSFFIKGRLRQSSLINKWS